MVQRWQGRPKIADVAAKAGVSNITVSRALSDHPDVGPETRRKIKEVADRLGYVPSASARALRTGRSEALGMVVPIDMWPWLSEMQRGVAQEIARSGYTLSLHPLELHQQSARDFLDRVLPRLSIDGLFIVMTDTLRPYVNELAARGLPVITFDDRVRINGLPVVVTTNEEGFTQATRHLAALGRRRIAVIAGPLRDAYARERFAGYRRGISEAGLAFDPLLVVTAEDHEPSAQDAVAALLSRPLQPDAIMACHDEMAIDVLAELRQAGRVVPDDIAVVGFDDIALARVTFPSLTTVRQPFYEMGIAAVKTLMRALESGNPPADVVIPASLVIRASCGSAPGARAV